MRACPAPPVRPPANGALPSDHDPRRRRAARPAHPVAARALDVARAWSAPALVNHCLRSWAWASLLAEQDGFEPDRELLFVAAMLHDLGVTPSFDANAVPFEDAGGAVGSVFAIGAGWDPARARRVGEVIERHMWTSVDPDHDVEGHLLEVATSLDVSGAGFERWQSDDLRAVTAALPGSTSPRRSTASSTRRPHGSPARPPRVSTAPATSARAASGGTRSSATEPGHRRGTDV